MKKNSTIQNGVFSKLSAAKMVEVSKSAKDAKIRLWSYVNAPTQESIPIAEALVAFDPTTDTIIKFIAAFIPPSPWCSHKGVKYHIGKEENGDHKPVVIHRNEETEKQRSLYWNSEFLTEFLDYSKLPMLNENAEFRILRAYRAGIRVAARFELLSFENPKPDKDAKEMWVKEDTMQVEMPFNSVPPISLAYCHRKFWWWQKQIIKEIGDFSGIDLTVALGLGIKRKLDKAVHAGVMSETVVEDILHDHSEDPIEMSESIAASFGVSNMVSAEGEGEDFYVPPNPLLKTDKDEVSEPLDASFELDNRVEEEDFDVPVNPLLKTDKEDEEELVEFFD